MERKTAMKPCDEFADALAALALGEEAGAGAKAHLESCPSCSAGLASLRQVFALAAQVPPAPEGYFDSLEGRLRARMEGRHALRRAERAWGGLAAAAMLALAALLWQMAPPPAVPADGLVARRIEAMSDSERAALLADYEDPEEWLAGQLAPELSEILLAEYAASDFPFAEGGILSSEDFSMEVLYALDENQDI
jgi:hypothetical protein